MPRKDYEDPVQIQLRILLNRDMVDTFALFIFEYDDVLEKNTFLICPWCMMPASVQ